MRKLATITLFALLAVTPAVAQQQWNFQKAFTTPAAGGHGIAVDPDGKIWFQPFGATETIAHPKLGNVTSRAVYVYNADGTPASFSPILYVDLPGGARDTLGGRSFLNTTGVLAWEGMSGRGMRADKDGNILVMQFNILYRLDYKTGAGLNKVVYGVTGGAPAVASDTGVIFQGPVSPGNAVKMYDKDFVELGNAIDKSRGFSRSFEVSRDGNKIYWGGYSNWSVTLYERADEFSPFDSVGTIVPGMAAESFGWQPGTGWLWLSAGCLDPTLCGVNKDATLTTNWLPMTHYAFDPADLAVNTVPTPKAFFTYRGGETCRTAPADAACGRPRGIAFSPDGQYAYTTNFTAPGTEQVEVFGAMPVAIEKIDASVPDRFVLMPAYPNPFNPTTNINFMLHETGHARLAVYDMTGREVAVLADQTMSAGTYQYTFDATGLTSGVYVYRLTFGGQVANGRLTLVK